MLFDKNSIAVGSADPLKTRVLLRQGEQTLDVPAAGMGLPLVAGANTFSGNNTFTGTTNFDGATDFDGANVFDGAVTFNSIPSLAGGAILFPATQVPSANANALDDYEEGTFTPGIAFGGGTTGITGTFTGAYTKIGNRVFVGLQITLTSKGSSTGTATVTGLPFAASATIAGGLVSESYTNMSGLSGSLVARITAGGTAATWRTGSATGHANLADTNFSNTTAIIVDGWYSV